MQQPNTPKCDIWSLACTIIELVTGFPPYFDSPAMTAVFKMVTEPHPPLPDDISPVRRPSSCRVCLPLHDSLEVLCQLPFPLSSLYYLSYFCAARLLSTLFAGVGGSSVEVLPSRAIRTPQRRSTVRTQVGPSEDRHGQARACGDSENREAVQCGEQREGQAAAAERYQLGGHVAAGVPGAVGYNSYFSASCYTCRCSPLYLAI